MGSTVLDVCSPPGLCRRTIVSAYFRMGHLAQLLIRACERKMNEVQASMA